MDTQLCSTDSFIDYKTYKHDNSVIYHFTTTTTTTNLGAWALSWVFPRQTHCHFLQSPTPHLPRAYNALEKAGVKLSPDARNGLLDSFESVVEQKFQLWNATNATDIIKFCDRHANKISMGVQERGVGYLHIVTIIWAPQPGDTPKKSGMQDFIKSYFQVQRVAA
jgi:hypothetical protein